MRYLLVLAAIGMVALLGWFYTADAVREPPRYPARQTETPAPGAAEPVATAPLSAQQRALLERPEARDYQDWSAFQARMRAAAGADKPLPPEEKAALLADLARYEAMGRVTPNEAAMVRLALARGEGEAALRAEANKLAEDIKAAQSAAEARRAAHPDLHFLAYKREEARIVEEVMAMSTIPGGVSRDEYLRQRLQQAREQAYSDSGNP